MKYNVITKIIHNREIAILVADYPYNKLYESVDWCNSNDLREIIKGITDSEQFDSNEYEFGSEQVNAIVKGDKIIFDYNYRPILGTDYYECDSNTGKTKDVIEILDIYLDVLSIVEKNNEEETKESIVKLSPLKIDIASGKFYSINEEIKLNETESRKFENQAIQFDIEASNRNTIIITLDPVYCNTSLNISSDDFQTVSKKIKNEINKLIENLTKSQNKIFNWGKIEIITDPRMQITYGQISYKKTVYNNGYN